MNTHTAELHCVNCHASEQDTPLLHLRSNGNELWICSQCLPTLIHAPQKLAGKIEHTDRIKPAPHHHE
ncbi:MAG: hypothetical protein EHM64_03570 [Ignavibacteriae bacterium]|nr:MAG: hypothetical protein EHM64_03570 [Ignavibacteriota bacterium]